MYVDQENIKRWLDEVDVYIAKEEERIAKEKKALNKKKTETCKTCRREKDVGDKCWWCGNK